LRIRLPKDREHFVRSAPEKVLGLNVRSAWSAGTGTPVVRCFFIHDAKAALFGEKIMNVESLAIERQETLQSQLELAPEQTPEILPLAFETFRLIGGGSSVVVL
jgi:hypothetical protein